MILEYLAAAAAVIGGFLVTSSSAQTRYQGFSILFAASALWIYVGVCMDMGGLVAQSVLFLLSAVLGLINNWRPHG